jgi:hypothetical protein
LEELNTSLESIGEFPLIKNRIEILKEGVKKEKK